MLGNLTTQEAPVLPMRWGCTLAFDLFSKFLNRERIFELVWYWYLTSLLPVLSFFAVPGQNPFLWVHLPSLRGSPPVPGDAGYLAAMTNMDWKCRIAFGLLLAVFAQRKTTLHISRRLLTSRSGTSESNEQY